MDSAQTQVDVDTLAKRAWQCVVRKDFEHARQWAEQVLSQDSTHADSHYILALCNFLAENISQALIQVGQALHYNAQHHLYHHLLGVIYVAQGKWQDAEACFKHTLVLNPGFAMAYFQLGVVYYQQQRLDEAIAVYQKALKLQPQHLDSMNNLGVTLKKMGRLAEAIEQFEAVLKIDPDHVNAHNNKGLTLQMQEKWDEALVCYQKAVSLDPTYADGYFNQGLVFYHQRRFKEAVDAYKKALEIRPDYYQAHNNWGLLLFDTGWMEAAVEKYQQAVSLKLDYIDAYNNMGLAFYQQGRFEEALASFKKAIELTPEPSPLWQFRMSVLLPFLLNSAEEIPLIRQRIDDALETWQKTPLMVDLSRLSTQDCRPSFYLPYQGENDLALKSKFADVFQNALKCSVEPALIRRPPVYHPENPHIGFLVTPGHEAAFFKVACGFVPQLVQQGCKVSVIGSAQGLKQVEQVLKGISVGYVPLFESVEKTVTNIKAHQFDVVYFLEIGTDPQNYYLPFFQLAAVQCTSWGFPETSGNQAVDYYLSSVLWEPPGAEKHYREQLVLGETLPVYYKRPVIPGKATLADFGLPTETPLYCCVQNLFKYHPQFDAILADIVSRDPQGKLVLFKSPYNYQTQFVANRLRQKIANLEDRVIWMPKLTEADYLRFLTLPELVFLDTIHYDGGITSYDTLSVGAAIVTWPSPFMRGRKTYGCYQKMQVLDCVARDFKHYAELAVSLGTDKMYRSRLQQKISEASGALYEDQQAAEELVMFFKQAVQAALSS